VTLAAVDGEEFDLAIQTIFPGQFDQPLVFSADVEKPIQEVLIGLWDHKVQPCDSDRPGCKTYGFLLDGSLASWPPNLYTDYKRQRILPETVTFQWSGPITEGLAKPEALQAFLRVELAVFGATLSVQDGADDPLLPHPNKATVLFKHPRDEVLAKAIAKQLGADSQTLRVEALATDFAVAVP
jgi:hypothetical protein